MKKFFVFLMCLSLVVLVSCGGSENSGGGEKGGESGCTTSKSIGTNSLTKDLSLQELYDSCVTEMANALHPGCSWQNNEEQAKKRIAEIINLAIYFTGKCTDSDTGETTECPDFIPSSLHIQEIKGCEVYSIDPQTECIAPCADIYFSTYDKSFTKVNVGANFDNKNFIKGDNGTVSFESDFNIGTDNKAVFSWSEKAGDGSKVTKKATIGATVVDESELEDPVEDCFWTRCSH